MNFNNVSPITMEHVSADMFPTIKDHQRVMKDGTNQKQMWKSDG